MWHKIRSKKNAIKISWRTPFLQKKNWELFTSSYNFESSRNSVVYDLRYYLRKKGLFKRSSEGSREVKVGHLWLPMTFETEYKIHSSPILMDCGDMSDKG